MTSSLLLYKVGEGHGQVCLSGIGTVGLTVLTPSQKPGMEERQAAGFISACIDAEDKPTRPSNPGIKSRASIAEAKGSGRLEGIYRPKMARSLGDKFSVSNLRSDSWSIRPIFTAVFTAAPRTIFSLVRRLLSSLACSASASESFAIMAAFFVLSRFIATDLSRTLDLLIITLYITIFSIHSGMYRIL